MPELCQRPWSCRSRSSQRSSSCPRRSCQRCSPQEPEPEPRLYDMPRASTLTRNKRLGSASLTGGIEQNGCYWRYATTIAIVSQASLDTNRKIEICKYRELCYFGKHNNAKLDLKTLTWPSNNPHIPSNGNRMLPIFKKTYQPTFYMPSNHPQTTLKSSKQDPN